MRLQTYINESMPTEGETIEGCVDYLLKNCQPFFKEFGNKYRFWRGTMRAPNYVYNTQTSRTERLPKDTDPEIHKFLDDYFKKKYGWKWRSEGVFTSADQNVAGYGEKCLFFPMGNYRYLYHPKVSDTNDIITSMDNIDVYQRDAKEEDPNGYNFADIMFEYLDDYKQDGITAYLKTGGRGTPIEVIWKVEKYVLVRTRYENELYQALWNRMK